MSWNDKEPHNMTGDEYMAKRCLELEQENKELKEEIERLKNDRRFFFAMVWDEPRFNGKYILSIENKAVKVEKMEEKE